MNRCNKQFFTIVLLFSFFSIDGMEKCLIPKYDVTQENQLSIQHRAALKALSKMSFTNDREILHIGSFTAPEVDSLAEKATGAAIYSIDMLTFNLHQSSGYDKIISFADWQVVKNPEQTFMNIARCLKKGAQFCIVLPYGRSPYLRVHYDVLTGDKWKECYNAEDVAQLYLRRELKVFIEQAGLFGGAYCSLIKTPFIFNTVEDFKAWIASSDEQLNGIPAMFHQDFINDVVTQYLQEYPLEEDDSVTLHLPYVIVSGYKS
jgi:SAM-dependent methyltransferase